MSNGAIVSGSLKPAKKLTTKQKEALKFLLHQTELITVIDYDGLKKDEIAFYPGYPTVPCGDDFLIDYEWVELEDGLENVIKHSDFPHALEYVINHPDLEGSVYNGELTLVRDVGEVLPLIRKIVVTDNVVTFREGVVQFQSNEEIGSVEGIWGDES